MESNIKNEVLLDAEMLREVKTKENKKKKEKREKIGERNKRANMGSKRKE